MVNRYQTKLVKKIKTTLKMGTQIEKIKNKYTMIKKPLTTT